MLQTLQTIEIRIQQSPESLLMDKLLDHTPIERADIEALDMFNDTYIDMLMRDDQIMRHKLAEILTRDAWMEVQPE